MQLGRFVYVLLVSALALTACSDSTVGTNNSPPEASIELPSVGTEVLEGAEVAFRGAVDDRTTAFVDLRVTWTSSLSGELFAGNADADGITAFSTSTLAAGMHTITLRVRDAEGASGQESVELSVVADHA